MLSANDRQKLDPTDDREFYLQPRLVAHVDGGFIDRLTDLYRERIPAGARVFDMMSSWISHLPEDVVYGSVVGHGLNAAELAKNPRLDRYFTQNLNLDLQLPLESNSFDAVLNTVSVQYLQYPEAIFSEVYRLLVPGGIAIFSFSNRMFYQKAIARWRDGNEASRVKLVVDYFRSIDGFTEPEVVTHIGDVPDILRWLGVGGGDPFYAVIAHKLEDRG